MYSFKLFPTGKIRAGMTQKKEGSFKTGTTALEKKFQKIGLNPPAQARQTHSDLILEVKHLTKTVEEGDALITQQKNLPLMVRVADCQGVLIYNPHNESIGAIHSGWKGSAQNIIGKTIQAMKKKYNSNPSDLMVEISPSLGPCCATFSNPIKELPNFCHPFILDNNHVDFWSLSKKQCQDEGVKAKNIHLPKACTMCDSDYFSHRRGANERMAVFIEMIHH